MKITAPAGSAFCSMCGGLFKVDAKKELPAHVAVGRGNLQCVGGSAVPEGTGVRSQGED
jgi:hypothetical protein